MKMNIKERRLKLWKMRQEEKGYDVSDVHTLEEAEQYFDKQPKVKKEETQEENAIEGQEENQEESQKANETESQIQDENSDTSSNSENDDDVEDITVSNPTLESPLE